MQGVVEFLVVLSRGTSQLSKPPFQHQRYAFEVQIEAAAVQAPGAGPSQLGVFNQEPRAARRKVRLADCSPRDEPARVASQCVASSSRAIWFGHLVLDCLPKSTVRLAQGNQTTLVRTSYFTISKSIDWLAVRCFWSAVPSFTMT